MPPRLKSLPLRRLVISYLAGLLSIATIAGGFCILFFIHAERDNALAAIINISGQQRTLSVRIAGLAAEYTHGDQSARAPLLAAADLLAERQHQLSALNSANSAPDDGALAIRAVYQNGPDNLNQQVATYAAIAIHLASQPPGAPGMAADMAYLSAQARAPLLIRLNQIVSLHQQQTEQALQHLVLLETASFGAILLALTAKALFIFAPILKRLRHYDHETKNLFRVLADERESLRITLHAIGDGVITADGNGNVAWLNPVAERLTGWTAEQARGQKVQDVFAIFHEETGAIVESPIATCMAERKSTGIAAQTVLRSRHGDVCNVDDSAAPIFDNAGNIVGAVLVFRDVTDQRKLAGEMSYRAAHDALTGLLNRTEFEHRLEHSLHKAHADQTENAVMFLDLDQFKLVNDTCGHIAGDQMLVQVAKILSGLVRASDAVARLGGDEFAILLDHCPRENAIQLAQKICDRMEQTRFAYGEQRFRIGASIGLVPINTRWADKTALMHAADACCYAAKEAGRNRVHCWSDTDTAIRTRHGQAQWATRLERALDENRFVLFAQRIQAVGAEDKGVHAEILLRMCDTDGALMMPGAFLPAAERFHLAPRIDRWVLSRALDWMRAQASLETIEMLSINLSGQSVADAAFQRWVLAELADAGPRISKRVCLEITETAAVTNLEDASRFIEQLKLIGVRVALDDFGAGASSFGYLKSMAADYLKIDGQFVRDLLTDKLDEAAVRCFIEIAGVVGMKTIAEFTETADIMEELRSMGIDFAQGYHVHKPAPIEELMQ